jgi:hypothetical protein
MTTAAPASVRMATVADEESVYRLLVEMHRYNSNGWGFDYDQGIVLSQIEAATRPPPMQRSDPRNQEVGFIGLVDDTDGNPVGLIGLFLKPPMWFTTAPCVMELFLYVRPGVPGRAHHERDLRAYGKWVHASMKADRHMADYAAPFPLLTGFFNMEPLPADPRKRSRFDLLRRLWRRWGGREVGVLWMVE